MRLLRLFAAFLLLFALPTRAAHGADTGSISGRVIDKANGHAIPFASVTIPAARKGGLTDSEGAYTISGLAPGAYDVKVQFLGYKPADPINVTVVAGKTATANFTLVNVVVKEEKVTEVSAQRKLVESKQAATVRTVTAGDIRNMSVSTVSDVLHQQAGISTEADQIHVRGGRSDETVFVVDGVTNRDLVTGQSTAGQLNARSVQEVNVRTGGFDVKQGNAISGVVEITMKEGGDRLEGGLTTSTGSFGSRSWQGQIGGPDKVWTPILRRLGVRVPGTLSSIIDVSGSFYETRYAYMNAADGDLNLLQRTIAPPVLHPRLHSTYEDSFFGHKYRYDNSWSPSEENHWALRYGLTWKPVVSDKVSLSFSKRLDIDQGFTRTGLTVNGNETDPVYPWAWNHRIDHAGTFLDDNVQTNLAWRHTMSTTGWSELRLSRYFTARREDVDGKMWWEYEEPDDRGAFPLTDPRRDDPFFDTGDAYSWQDRRSNIWALGGLTTTRYGHNEVELGFDHQWQTVQRLSIEYPWDYDPNGLGRNHDLWVVHPWLGDLYIRDLLEFEGFKANVGLRADYWVIGREAEQALADSSRANIASSERSEFFHDTQSLFGRRMKIHFSPRVMVSHPISEESKFFFNYGQFTQIPQYQLVYAKLKSISSESFPVQGNPNLNPKISVNYEVGGEHQFSPVSAMNVTFFVRDVYDYPAATRVDPVAGSNIESYFIYLNGHFSRSKGAEIVVEKRPSHHWSGKLSYSYQQTRGKSGNPNQDLAIQEIGGSNETRLSEVFVGWNRPHKLSANFDLRFDKDAPRHWGLLKQSGFNLFIQGQSGRPYTPQPYGPHQDNAVYSANGLFQLTTDLKINHWYRAGSRRFDLSLSGTNIFNNALIYRLNTDTGTGLIWGEGGYDPTNPYNTIGASTRLSDLLNPSNYGTGAQWRLQLDVDL
jgi:hypothetical protein